MEIGDRFLFVDEVGGGTILEKDRDKFLVLTDDGFEYWVSADALMPDHSESISTPKMKGKDELKPSGWEPGARVSYLNEAGGGTLVSIQEDIAKVLDDDGFERPFSLDSLVLVIPEAEEKMSSGEVSDKDRVHRSHKMPGERLSKEVYEVDLHMTELLEFDSHLSDHDKLQHQLRVAKHQVEKARQSGYKKVVLIHGVGKGVLKEKLLEMLNGMPKLEYHDGNMQKYGVGATEVVFHGNARTLQ